MAIICPTILAKDAHDYRRQLARVQTFARRLQIDLTDGVFAPVKTVGLSAIRWPAHARADLHLMYRNPLESLKAVVALKPHLVIVHAEARGDFIELARALHGHRIKVGLALLPETTVESIQPALEHIDHLLIFSGDLGHFGGTADLGLLAKVQAAKHRKPSLEIGWDGGINDKNVHLLAAGGVDVLNVGGFIQRASNPVAAYATLKAQL